MRVLLIADNGDGFLDLALRATAGGHQVKFFCRKFDPRTRPIGKGLVDHVADWRPWVAWADIVLLEGNGVYMSEMASLRQRGVRIIGGDVESAAWELDRKKGMEVFRKAGIAVPAYREFTDYDAAIRHVERHGEVYYSKPCSDTADKSLSAKTGTQEDPTWMLRKWKKKHVRPPCPFLLQEKIDGVEFAVGAWWGPAGWADGWEENFEHKQFMSGGVGPNTGEMGTVMRYVRRSRLAERVLVPLETQLARLGYCGNVDVNCIIDTDGDVWPLEFTMRFGWPAFNIECALLEKPIEFLSAVAQGESTRGFHKLNEVAVGVVVAIPPYPHPPAAYEDIVGIPVFGVGGDDHWHPCEMMSAASAMRPGDGLEEQDSRNTTKQQNGHRIVKPGAFHNLSSAGHYIGVATGTGATVREAARGAYRVIDKISMPVSHMYRDDIGEKLKKDLPALQEHGFAAGMEY